MILVCNYNSKCIELYFCISFQIEHIRLEDGVHIKLYKSFNFLSMKIKENWERDSGSDKPKI